MARKQKSVTIRHTADAFTYELSQLGAVEGRELVILFVRVLGRFAPMIVAAMKASSGGDGIVASKMVEEVAALMQTLDSKELEPLWDAFARHASVRSKDGKSREVLSDVFDEHFAGEYSAMIHFFIEAAKLNFGDFLSRALAQASAPADTDATP